MLEDGVDSGSLVKKLGKKNSTRGDKFDSTLVSTENVGKLKEKNEEDQYSVEIN